MKPTLLARLGILFVRAYQLVLSPVLHTFFGARCRFQPTCSQYAIEALRMNGAARGSLQAIRRIFRCHPWHPGGFDPPKPLGRAPRRPSPADQVDSDG